MQSGGILVNGRRLPIYDIYKLFRWNGSLELGHWGYHA
jgi:hypothetical protein